MQNLTAGSPVGPAWLNTPTGRQLLQEEAQHVRRALDSIFGDQFLQIGAWGDVSLHAYARTQRSNVVGDVGKVDVEMRPQQLAIATDSVDAVFLPHVLESYRHPHAVLREVDRVVRSDGHIIITGFNPISLWGLRHFISRRKFPAGGNRMITERRVRDWLTLLDYSIDDAVVFNFLSPVFRAAAAQVPRDDAANAADLPPTRHSKLAAFVERCRRHSPFAGCYMLVARKQMITLTPMRPAWRRRPRLVGGLVNPTTRNAA